MKKVLCICSKGLNRSKYLAKYLKSKGYVTRFGGIEVAKWSGKIPNPISQKDVDWADVLVIVRPRLVDKIKKMFNTEGKKFVAFDVTDSPRLLPKKYKHLKTEKNSSEKFAKDWREPQLRKAIDKFLPL